MFLDSNKKLVAVLTAAKTTLDMPVLIDYVDITSSATNPAPAVTFTNGVIPTDILGGTMGAVPASTTRKVNGLEIYQRDTVAKTLLVYLVDAAGSLSGGAFVTGVTYQITAVGTTNFTLIGASANTLGVIFTATGAGSGSGTASPAYQLCSTTLQITDLLGYTDTTGWYVQDLAGNRRAAYNLPIGSLPSKTTPVNADSIGFWDSVTGALAQVTWANLKATLVATINTWSANQIFTGGVDTTATALTIAPATSSGQAVQAGQIQSGALVAFTTGGTGTAYTLTPTPAITSYAANQTFSVAFNAAAGVAPTLAISGLASPPNLVRQAQNGTYFNIAANDFPAAWQSPVKLISPTQALVMQLPGAVKTWTPVFSFGGGSVTYTATGYYTHICGLVTCTARLVITALSSPTGIISIIGIPFNPIDNTVNGRNAVAGYAANFIVGAGLIPMFYFVADASRVDINTLNQSTGATAAGNAATMLTTTTEIDLTFSYFAN